jgi:cytochrome d ubiquinol oxidase subunit I
MNVLLLSRIQFGITIGFHFLFPSITIGLAWYLVALEAATWRRANEGLRPLTRLFGRIFAVTFVVGVVTGVVMSVQFGTNWAGFMRAVNDIFGTFLLAEVLFAFFLESVFFAIWYFGGARVPQWLRWLSILIVALGTTISGFWILAANSWMQTPAGFALVEGRLRLASFADALFSPSMLPRFFHTINASLVTASFLVVGTCAYAILKGAAVEKAKRVLAVALVAGAVFSVLAIFPTGHQQAVEVERNQPVKLAAMEGLDETQEGAPFTIFGIPMNEAPYVKYRVAIPRMLSFLFDFKGVYEVEGLEAFTPAERPPIVPVFSAFHLMVLLGLAFVGVTCLGILFLIMRKLFEWRWMLWLLVIAIPFPLLCIQMGWITTEVGRQPWLVWKLVKTADAMSPSLSGAELVTSLALFSAAYLALGIAYVVLLVRAIRKGPAEQRR